VVILELIRATKSDLCKLEGLYLFVSETYRQKRVFPMLIQNN